MRQSRKYFLISTLLILCVGKIVSQSISPSVFGSAGGMGSNGSAKFYFQIGEPVIATGNSSTTYYTQGFVQPSYDTALSVLNVFINYSNESCLDANDGSINLSLFGVQGNASIVWNHTTQDSNLLTNLSPGNYSFIVVDSLSNGSVIFYNNGNPITLSILEETNPCPLDPINSFSPNFDGVNEAFVINGIENYPNNKVSIFNRWGNLIWETKNYSTQNKWNGKDKSGNEIIPGTYFYLIEIDNLKQYKGWVEVIK